MLSCTLVRRFPGGIDDPKHGVLKGPLPTSLLKTKRDGQRQCVEMFDCVLRWTSLSNWVGHAEERERMMQRILEIVGSNVYRVDELCLQILKQTRGQMDRMRERNTWRLFAEVIDDKTPSTVSRSDRPSRGTVHLPAGVVEVSDRVFQIR